MRYFTALAFLSVLALASCRKNNASKIPHISTLSIAPDSIIGGSSGDTVYLSFHFTDGDADLGNNQNTTNYDIYIKDLRTNTVTGYFFPSIPSQIEDPNVGLEGDCRIKLLAAFIIPRPDHLLLDTVRYEVYIKDKAQNESNHLTTPNIIILP
ncbi:MAG: hypothetical protein H0X33_01155 [Taibaiella sp.]|nr:hypothetical protein [Taibaiella sp.]